MRNKTEQEQEFLRDVERLQLIICDERVFHSEGINIANAYEKVIEFFQVVKSIAEKGFYDLLPLKGWEICGIMSRSRKRAESTKKLFVESIQKVLLAKHNHDAVDISSDTIFFGTPMRSIRECKKQIDSDFQERTRTEILDFVESFKGKFPLDWIRE